MIVSGKEVFNICQFINKYKIFLLSLHFPFQNQIHDEYTSLHKLKQLSDIFILFLFIFIDFYT